MSLEYYDRQLTKAYWEFFGKQADAPEMVAYVRDAIAYVLDCPEGRTAAMIVLQETLEEEHRFAQVSDVLFHRRQRALKDIHNLLHAKRHQHGILLPRKNQDPSNLPTREKALPLLVEKWKGLWCASESKTWEIHGTCDEVNYMIDLLTREEREIPDPESMRCSMENLMKAMSHMPIDVHWMHRPAYKELQQHFASAFSSLQTSETNPLKILQMLIIQEYQQEHQPLSILRDHLLFLERSFEHLVGYGHIPDSSFSGFRVRKLLQTVFWDLQRREHRAEIKEQARLWKERDRLLQELRKYRQVSKEEEERAPSAHLDNGIDKLKRELSDFQLLEEFAQCNTPEEHMAFYKRIGVPDEKILDYHWMMFGARENPKRGGVGRDLRCIVEEAKKRFHRWENYRWFIENRPMRAFLKNEEQATAALMQFLQEHQLSPQDLRDKAKFPVLLQNKQFRKLLNFFSKLAAEEKGRTISQDESSAANDETDSES